MRARPLSSASRDNGLGAANKHLRVMRPFLWPETRLVRAAASNAPTARPTSDWSQIISHFSSHFPVCGFVQRALICGRSGKPFTRHRQVGFMMQGMENTYGRVIREYLRAEKYETGMFRAFSPELMPHEVEPVICNHFPILLACFQSLGRDKFYCLPAVSFVYIFKNRCNYVLKANCYGHFLNW